MPHPRRSATSWHTDGDSHVDFEFARVIGSRMREPMSVRRAPATGSAATQPVTAEAGAAARTEVASRSSSLSWPAEAIAKAAATPTAALPARLSAAPELLSAAADEVDSAAAHMEELVRRYEGEMGLAPACRTDAPSTTSDARQWNAAALRA